MDYEKMMLDIIENDEVKSEDMEEVTALPERTADAGVNFAREIRRQIRGAFIKAGAVLLGILLAVLIFIQFGLSPLVSSFYYNPGEMISFPVENPDGNTGEFYEPQQRIDLDLCVYTELRYPMEKRDSVMVLPQGYGTYQLVVPQSIHYPSYREDIGDVAGTLTRDSLTWYNPNFLKGLPINQFWMTDNAVYDIEGGEEQYLAEKRKYFDEGIENMAGGELRKAAVSYRESLSYSRIRDLEGNYSLGAAWHAVQTEDVKYDGKLSLTDGFLGYQTLISGRVLNYDREKYPYLLMMDVPYNSRIDGWDAAEFDFLNEEYLLIEEEETTTQHFTSMLKYMIDNPEFLKVVTGSEDASVYQAAADYVEANGMKVYGSVIYADKALLKRLADDPRVKYIEFCSW